MSQLAKWQIVSIILFGIILGYAGGRVEMALTGGSIIGGKAQVAAENGAPAPAPQEEKLFLTEEEEELLVDEDRSDPMLGDEDAPVIIVEFSEFQCPFCKRHSEETMPQIKKDYIDTGKAKYYFRDIPLGFHPQAVPAAKAANCALEQGKYWEMHDAIFEKRDEWSGSPEVEQLFAVYAQELGLDTDKLEECMLNEKTAQEIEKDMQTAALVGVEGTPTFFINGEKLVGAQPYEAFKAAIEKALAD